MTDRTRPRRRHAAQGARWMTAGLAVSGTLGITSYLQVAHHDRPPATLELVQLSEATPPATLSNGLPLTTGTVVAPPVPTVTITTRVPAPVVQPPRRQVVHATTRGSGG